MGGPFLVPVPLLFIFCLRARQLVRQWNFFVCDLVAHHECELAESDDDEQAADEDGGEGEQAEQDDEHKGADEGQVGVGSLPHGLNLGDQDRQQDDVAEEVGGDHEDICGLIDGLEVEAAIEE